MKLEDIEIKDSRNSEKINPNLTNKNISFGLNDVEKTNSPHALRYVFDKDTRKLSLLDSDFHNKGLNKPIEILITLDISGTICIDC